VCVSLHHQSNHLAVGPPVLQHVHCMQYTSSPLLPGVSTSARLAWPDTHAPGMLPAAYTGRTGTPGLTAGSINI
jgi:hypothetical protein